MNRLLGYLVTFLMIFVVFDGVLRLAGCSPQATINEFHPSWGWAKTPDATTSRSTSEFDVTFAINDKGLRNPPLKHQNVVGNDRVLFVGDSFTLGYAVADDDLFLRRMERSLRAAGHDVDAINGGTEGYSTDQEITWYEEEGAKYEAEVVVLVPYLNDVFWNTQPNYTRFPKPRYELVDGAPKRTNPTLEDPGQLSWFKRNTALGDFVNKMQMGKYAQTTPVDGAIMSLEDAPILADPPSRIEDAWRITGALIRRFAEKVRANGAKPVALLVANRWEIHPDDPGPRTGLFSTLDHRLMDPAGVTDRFAELCAAAGLLVIDPREALAAKAATGTRVYFEKDFHWNVAGNHVVGDVLTSRFLEDDLLGAGTGEATAAALPPDDAPDAGGGLSKWIVIPGVLWLLLGFLFCRSYPHENPALAFVKVGLLIGLVVGILKGVTLLSDALPPSIGAWVFPLLAVGILVFVLVKVGKQLDTIKELYGTFLRRGHWYILPMLVVMLSIGMLLVVAASSPFVAPFIYTLF
ncbi:MAG: DUF5989 family protein [Planctomycetota bacterium JB042]